MRPSLLPLALLLLGALPACTVNYYVGGTRPQPVIVDNGPGPQPGYDYDYPTAGQPVASAPSGPTRVPPRTYPPRTPRTNPPGSTASPGGTTTVPAPSTPTSSTGSTQPPLLPTAPPKRAEPATPRTKTPPTNPASQAPTGGLLPTAPPKPAPGTTPVGSTPRQDEAGTQQPPVSAGGEPLLPTAPPKQANPIKKNPGSSEPLLPTAPPKPAPGTTPTARQDEVGGSPVAAGAEPLLPTAPPKRARVEKSSPNTDVQPGDQAAQPVIVFRKTPCFGPCPQFEATIYADGRVRYVGERNVAKVGTYNLKLPAASVQEMLRQAEEIGFQDLQNQYMSGATDMPSTFITLSRPGQAAKTIQVEEGAPQGLVSLLTYINNELSNISGVPGESGPAVDR